MNKSANTPAQINRESVAAANENSLPISSIQRASQKLQEELLKPQAQAVWSRYLSSQVPSDTQVLSYRAISRAIAAAEFSRYGIENSPNRYKDRVRRAILGQRMTVETLRFFAETFSFEENVTAEIQELITNHVSPVYDPLGTQKPRFMITTSLKDIYFDENREPQKMRCNLMIRAEENACKFFWAPTGEEIKDITVNYGGKLLWRDDIQQLVFELNHPLDISESAELDYTIHFVGGHTGENEPIMHAVYPRPRPHAIYRFFFDEKVDISGQNIKIQRKSLGEGGKTTEWIEIKIQNNRASIYLTDLGHEELLFYL